MNPHLVVSQIRPFTKHGKRSGHTRLTFLFTLSTKIVNDMQNMPTSSNVPPKLI